MASSIDEPVFGHCVCLRPGAFLVWDRAQRVGVFACSDHLWYVKKQHGGGGVERMG